MRTDAGTRIWEEAPRGGYGDPALFFRLSGLELHRAFLAGRSLPPPIQHLTGMRPTDVGPGTSTFEMPATRWLLSPAGWIQLGTLAILADGPLGTAVQTAVGPATRFTTAEISLTALRPVGAGGTLVARGRLIRAGRSLGLSEVGVEDGRGALVAHGTSRCFLFPPLAAPPGLPEEEEAVQAPSYPTPDPYLRSASGDVLPQEVWDRHSGLEVLRLLIAGELPAPPVHHLTGLRPVDAGEGTCTFALPATEWLNSPLARVEGGAIAMVAETALIGAVQTTVAPGTSFAPFDLKVNFLRPVSPDGRDLLGHGTVAHRGRSLAVATSEVRNADGGLVALAVGTSMILPGRPWRRPAVPEDEPADPGEQAPDEG